MQFNIVKLTYNCRNCKCSIRGRP